MFMKSNSTGRSGRQTSAVRAGGLSAALVLATALGGVAEAATFTVYKDRAAFLAAAGKVSVETFNSSSDQTVKNSSIDFGSFVLSDERSSRTPGDTQITTRANSSPNGSRYVETLGYDYGEVNLIGFAKLTFDAPVTAFGGEFGSGSVGFVQFLVGADKINDRALALGGFLGFISDTAFTELRITAPRFSGAAIQYDNLTFSSAAVPEPASWAMMIAGFAAVGAAARRRPHPQATRRLA